MAGEGEGGAGGGGGGAGGGGGGYCILKSTAKGDLSNRQ